MDQIHKISGVWRSMKQEDDAKKCHINMSKRLPLLSMGENYELCCGEWLHISGHNEGLKDENGKSIKSSICLCGQKISKTYYFMNNKTKNICVVGSECCKRINASAFKLYNESLKKKGTCWLCNTKHRDLETHFNSVNHKKALGAHQEKFIIKLNILIRKKVENEKILKEIYEKSKTLNKCVEQFCINFIAKDEPSWKVRCFNCYKKYTNVMKNKKVMNLI